MQQGEGQGGQLPPQILADQLTLSQPGGADYAHHSTTCTPWFLTLAASLKTVKIKKEGMRHLSKNGGASAINIFFTSGLPKND